MIKPLNLMKGHLYVVIFLRLMKNERESKIAFVNLIKLVSRFSEIWGL